MVHYAAQGAIGEGFSEEDLADASKFIEDAEIADVWKRHPEKVVPFEMLEKVDWATKVSAWVDNWVAVQLLRSICLSRGHADQSNAARAKHRTRIHPRRPCTRARRTCARPVFLHVSPQSVHNCNMAASVGGTGKRCGQKTNSGFRRTHRSGYHQWLFHVAEERAGCMRGQSGNCVFPAYWRWFGLVFLPEPMNLHGFMRTLAMDWTQTSRNACIQAPR